MRRHDKARLPLSAAAAQLWALEQIKDSRPPKTPSVRRAAWQGQASLVRRAVHAVARRPHPRRV